jgi:hypothetical protein
MKAPRWNSTKEARPSPEHGVQRAESRSIALRCYDAWREAAYDVEAASCRWRTASRDERPAAASGYSAALEREEKAATEYQLAWRAWRSSGRLWRRGR